jgi:hypothetical protein
MTIAGARAKLFSMKTLAATATILLLVSAPLLGLAQETGMPDTSYQASTVASAPAEPEVLFPDTDPGGDGSTVTVPIPGGGSVTVEGPATPDENPPFSSPIETWADRTQTPNSVTGTTPLGP